MHQAWQSVTRLHGAALKGSESPLCVTGNQNILARCTYLSHTWKMLPRLALHDANAVTHLNHFHACCKL